MTDQSIAVAGTSKFVDTQELSTGAGTVQRQVVVVGDPSSANAMQAVDEATGAAAVQVFARYEGSNDAAPLSMTDEGHLEVAVMGPRGVFGETITADLQPVVEGDFVYGINTNSVSSAVTGSGAAASSNRMGVASTTAAASSSALIRSVRVAKYRPGHGMVSRFTAMFTSGVANSKQIAGMFNSTVDAYGVGFNGASFGVLYRRDSVDTWVSQAAFNLDPLDGTGNSGFTIDPTKLNIFQIQAGYLGTLGFTISVMNSLNNQWVEFHQFALTNTLTAPQVVNPTMYFGIYAENTSNTSNVAVSSASFMIALEGKRERLGGTYGVSTFKSIGTTQTNVVTLRNNSTINGVTNRSMLRIRSVSFATAASVPAIFLLTKNATLGGSPSYTNVDATNSLAAYDTAGTTITGGNQQWNTTVGANGHTFADLTDFDIYLLPGETLTLSAASISGGANNQVVAVNWSEDV